MKPSPARRVLAAFAAFAITAAVVAPLALDAQPAEAATYTAPFVGSVALGTWNDNELGRMFVGQPYNDQIWATSGLGSVAVENGSLPAGLTLSYDYNDSVVKVTGTPVNAGDSTFSIRVASPDLSYQGYLTFNVSVLPAPPTTTVYTNVTLDSPLVAGSSSTFSVRYQTSGTNVALTPKVTLTMPAGLTITNLSLTDADWSCSNNASFVSCTSSIDRPKVGFIGVNVFTVTVAADAALYGAVRVTAVASAGNGGSATVGIDAPITTTVPVIVVPAQVPYGAVPITAYAPSGLTGGSMSFYYTGAGATDEFFGGVSLGGANSTTYTATLPPATSGQNVTIQAIYVSASNATTVSAIVPTYSYKQSTMAGTFYLNGEPYAGAVNFRLYSDAGSSGAFIQYPFPGAADGSYTFAPYFGFGHKYYSWAELPEYGNALTFYNAAGLPTIDSNDRTTISDANFSNSMNYYWELPAVFTDSTVAVPRYNVAFTDGVVASSNVDVEYFVSSGALPDGLSLNSTTGAITGTATTVGEVYSFVIKADNGVIDAFTPTITGTVLPTHIIPNLTDSTLPSFRYGTAVVDGVLAAGDGPIAYVLTDGSLPSGLALDALSGAVTGTPTVANEAYDFTIAAENAWGSDDAQFTGTVSPALAAPVWTDSTIGELRVGETLADEVSASGEPVPTYTITGKPSWLTLDATTGAISGSPTAADTFDFTITATNSQGDVDQRFLGTVWPAWIAPSFTDGDIAQPQGGVFLDDGVLASGDATITYSVPLGAMPTWLTLDAATGRISGTPPLSAVGDTYSFTVTASGHGTDTTTVSGFVSAAPTVELTLGFVVGDVAAGAPFDYAISRADDSAPFSVTVNSTPTVVASGTISGLGTASGSTALPASIAAGAHSIVLLTYASDGTPRAVTVWFTVLRNGTIGAISLLGPLAYSEAALSNSGVDAGPIALAALLLLGGGYVLRRRRA